MQAEGEGAVRDGSNVLFFVKENPGGRTHLAEKIIILGPFEHEVFERNPAGGSHEHLQNAN